LKRIIYLPLQPLNERYTFQWYSWFPREFEKYFDEVIVIDGKPLTKTIEKGAFLDVNSAFYWEMTQLRKVVKMMHNGQVKDNDYVFCADIEFPGLVHSINLLSLFNKVKVNLYGFVHAMSTTTEDFVSPFHEQMKYLEVGWLNSFNAVFVGSNYHRNIIISKLIRTTAAQSDVGLLTNKLIVSGNPWLSEQIKTEFLEKYGELPRKENIVIFPNRFDYDKRPNLFMDLAEIICDEVDDVKFLLTTSRPYIRSSHPWLVKRYKALKKLLGDKIDYKSGLGKMEYYYELAKSKIMISISIEENFGYCPIESLTFGTYPLVPNRYSYKETVSNEFRYEDMDDLIKKTLYYIKNFKEGEFDLSKYEKVIGRMCDVMLNGRNKMENGTKNNGRTI